jgi:outer membrane protein OmpA-like peptidoglycan-associated protein
MKHFCIALLAAAAFVLPAAAQDVPVLSIAEAEDLLADPEPACAGTAADGSCIAEPPSRAFRFVPVDRRPATATARPAPAAQVRAARTGAAQARAAPVRTGPVRSGQSQSAGASAARRDVPLQFAVGSFELSPQSRINLRTFAAALNTPQNSAKRIRISGHTDRSGSAETNRHLSQRRADAVTDYLVAEGVNRDRIDSFGAGFEDPLTGVSPYSPHQRRVEIVRVQ